MPFTKTHHCLLIQAEYTLYQTIYSSVWRSVLSCTGVRFNERQSELMPFTKTHHRSTALNTAIVCYSGFEIEYIFDIHTLLRTQSVAFCQAYGLLQSGPPRWRHQPASLVSPPWCMSHNFATQNE